MPDIMEWTVGDVYDISAGCTCTCHCGCVCSGGNHSTTRTNTANTKCTQLKDGLSGTAPTNRIFI